MANQPKKYKKFVATAATATLVASAIVPVASAKSFSDVAENNEFQPFIDALSDAGIINGYPDGTFKPGAKLTRGQVVKMLGRWVESNGAEVPADWDSVQRFNDVPVNSADQELVKYAALVKDAGVFTGSNGNLMAGNNITRQQMAKVLNGAFTAVNGTSLVDLADNIDNKLVTDLASAQQEFEGYIQALVDLQISTVSVFRPSENVTRAQFAKFLYNTINLEAAVSANVKAINNTTVEVTFGEAIADVKDLTFKIDGLEVKNAVVKQTDAKTAVLTTAAQESGKEYTVTVNGKTVGKFTGIAAVIPTSISLVERSQQGVLGQQVTLKAQVTVAEGQSKAGIPVTFNVTGTGSLNTPQLFEATTDENGVASYTYTRYANTTDDVVAYATGDRTKYSPGKVYWATAQQLTIKDVTGVNNLANNDSKVYEINSANNANKYVFVTFKENLNVTADKVVRTVGAKGSSTYVLNQNNTISSVPSDYPYEITTGAKAVIAVKLDPNGKANLVLAGANATVTPVVYEGVAVDGNDAGSIAGDQLNEFTNASYNATALQATAPSVSFEAKHNLGLTIEAAGVANAATYKSPTETGGRDYTVTYVDKDGKPAAANTVVQVAIPVQTASNGVFLIDDKGNEINGTTRGEYRVFNVTVKGSEGKAKFTVGSRSVTQYVEPIAFIDNGTGIGAKAGLDATDLQAKGVATHFTDAVTYSTSLKLVDADDEEIKSVFAGGEAAYFLYETVDQNGKPRAYRLADGTLASTTLTYSVTAGTSPLFVQGKTIPAGGSDTFTAVVPAGSNKGRLAVTANAGTTATVYATASVAGLVLGTTEAVTAQFTSTSVVNVTGTVTEVNKTTGIVMINGVPYALAGATYLNNGAVVPTLAAFYDHLTVGKEVSVTKDADGKLVFNVTGVVTSSTGKLVSAVVSDETADAAGLVDTITFTFDKDVDATTVAAADFVLSGTGTYALTGNPTVSGKTVKFSITPAPFVTTAVVENLADVVGFVDGTGNTAVSALAVTSATKVSKVFTATANKVGVTAVDATGKLTVGTNETVVTVDKAVNDGAAGTPVDNVDKYNGFTIKFVQDPSNGGTPTAEFTYPNTITVKVGFNNATASDIEAAIATISTTAPTGLSWTNFKVTGDDVNYNDITANTSLTLANGKVGVTGSTGVYNFAMYDSLTVGNTVTVNGITYTKVVSGAQVAANKTFYSLSDLAASIQAVDSRFATVTESTGVFTLTEDASVAQNGAAAPTVTVQ